MNIDQFAKTAKKLKINPELTKAAKLVIFDGKTGHQAEMAIYNKTTTTANRAARKIEKEFKFALNLILNTNINSNKAK